MCGTATCHAMCGADVGHRAPVRGMRDWRSALTWTVLVAGESEAAERDSVEAGLLLPLQVPPQPPSPSRHAAFLAQTVRALAFASTVHAGRAPVYGDTLPFFSSA